MNNSSNSIGGLLAFRNDRLGGRLNAILTGFRLAQKYDIPFRVFWPAHEDTSIELRTPEDLFDRDFMDSTFLDQKAGGPTVRKSQDIGGMGNIRSGAAFKAAVAKGTWFLSNSATEQQLLPWENPSELKEIPKLLNTFPFSRVVRDMIGLIEETLGNVAFKSYHLRRGDIIDDTAFASHNTWSNKYIPRVIYEWHIKRELERGSGQIVVFSDTPAETIAFCKMSGRVVSFDNLIEKASLTILQRDFLELYVMSRSEKIFAPPSSAFSGVAAALGNLKVTDISEDLTPKMHTEAMDELTDRLERRPNSFLSQSDLAQNIPFVLGGLVSNKQHDRARNMLRSHIENGVDRAFVYPLLSYRLLVDGDFDGFDDLLEIMRKRPCIREEHAGTVYAHAAIAEIVCENWDKALHYYHISAWFSPINQLTNEIFWYLELTGKLSPKDTYPYDTRLMRKAGRVFKEHEPVFINLMRPLHEAGVQLRQYPAFLNVRDWRKIQGKKLNSTFNKPDKIIRQAEAVQRFFKKEPDDSTFVLSAVGALLSEGGETRDGEEMLRKSVRLEPENPLFLKRLSDHNLRMGRNGQSLDQLEEATQLSQGHLCYSAELATRLFREKRKDDAAVIIEELQKQSTDLLEVRLYLIDIMRRNSATLPQVPAMLDELSQIAPGSHRILSIKAKALERLREFDASLEVIRELQKLGRQDTIIRSKNEGLYKHYVKVHSEDEGRKWLKSSGINEKFDFV